MKATVNPDPKRTRVITYAVLAVAVVTTMIIGVLLFESAQDSAEAREKAVRLQTEFTEAGLPVPSQDQIVRILGTDGGPVCENPNSALHQAALNAQLANGSGGPGTRSTVVDRNVVKGEALAISIYCPEELPGFTEYVQNLKTDDVRND
jgi:hypothetical protein